MTCLIAFVLATRQRETALDGTDMVDVDAAVLVAFVLAAVATFGAALFASGVVGASAQQFALHHLIHVTAATLDGSLAIARWTLAGVAA